MITINGSKKPSKIWKLQIQAVQAMHTINCLRSNALFYESKLRLDALMPLADIFAFLQVTNASIKNVISI